MPDDLRYVVGDTYGMNATQARAHRVRQFVVYQGEDKFDIQPMLDSMSVKFVRLKQYTVYPYYFHLIDLYIDNVLSHQRRMMRIESNEDSSGDGIRVNTRRCLAAAPHRCAMPTNPAAMQPS